jgi:uncharacterized membrane protein YccC
MFAHDGLTALGTGYRPLRNVRLPTHRDFPVASRGAARMALAFALTAALFVALGWPATTYALVQVAAMGAMSSVNPDPLKYADGVLIGIPLAALSAGLILLVIPPTVNGFPILSLAVAPVVLAACLLIATPPPRPSASSCWSISRCCCPRGIRKASRRRRSSPTSLR